MCAWDIDRATYCPEKWAQDSNAIVCDYAYGRYVNGSDLYLDGYAKGAFHIVENQLAKAAWRTAGWLNTVANRYLGGSGAESVGEEGLPGIEADVEVDERERVFRLPEDGMVVQG